MGIKLLSVLVLSGLMSSLCFGLPIECLNEGSGSKIQFGSGPDFQTEVRVLDRTDVLIYKGNLSLHQSSEYSELYSSYDLHFAKAVGLESSTDETISVEYFSDSQELIVTLFVEESDVGSVVFQCVDEDFDSFSVKL